MAGDFVSDDQAGAVGGGDKKGGAQGDNTFQNFKEKQLVVLVRFKPKPVAALDTSAAAGMLGGITGAIEGAVSAVEDAAASIPGLDMFIKEKKEDSSSDKEYKYEYADWDSGMPKLEGKLKEINPDNKVDTFEFESTDFAGRKSDAQKLLSKIKSGISGWAGYTSWIHLVGIGQGGNVINECSDLLAKDGQFKSEKWSLKTVCYVATPLYKKDHLLNEAALKSLGKTISFGSSFDLTQQAIEYFSPNDELISFIKDSNKNTLSLAVGKIKLRVLKVLSLVLGGLNLSLGDQSDLNKFDKIKDEIKGLIKDITDLITQLVDEALSFIKLGDLPEFKKMIDGYSKIPDEAMTILKKTIDDLLDKIQNDAKKANMSLSPNDLAGFLNCLCPLFDHIRDSLKVLSYESKSTADLVKKIIEKSGVKEIHQASTEGTGENLMKFDPLYETVSKNPDDAKGVVDYIVAVKTAIISVSDKETVIDKMDEEHKLIAGDAIGCLLQPMLISKQKVFEKLLGLFDSLHINSITDYFSANKLMETPKSTVEKLVMFPEQLKSSINGVDKEIERIKNYFRKKKGTAGKDSLYFIYNAHNVVTQKMFDAIAYSLDQQTGYLTFQNQKGFESEFPTTGKNTYKKTSETTPENVMPANELQPAT